MLDSSRVLGVHRTYVAAGAEVIGTNSFGANAIRLSAAGLADEAERYSRCAAELAREVAREVAGSDLWVAGSLGPTGQFLEPLGDLTESAAAQAFGAQAAALAAGGADLLLIETMADLGEAATAIAAARETGLPVGCTFVFDSHGRTLMGATPEQAAEVALAAGADLVGVNCGDRPEFVGQAIERMHGAYPEALLVAQPNAGLPQLQGDSTVTYDVGPEDLAAYADRFVATGVHLLGSCCGSTPMHTAALAGALRSQA